MDKQTLLEKLEFLLDTINNCEYGWAVSKYSPDEVRGHASYIKGAILSIRQEDEKPDKTLFVNLNKLHREYKEFIENGSK